MQSTILVRRLSFGIASLAIVLGVSYLALPIWITTAAEKMVVFGDAQSALSRIARWEWVLGSRASFERAKAEAYRKLGDPLRLEKHVNRAIELGMPLDEARRPMRLWLAQCGFTDEPFQYLGPLLQAYRGREFEVYESFLKGYSTNWHLGEGRRLIELWREQEPNNPRIFYWDGVFRAIDYQIVPATKLLQKAIDLDPEYWQARLRLAELLVEQAKLTEAEMHYEVLMETHPNHRMIQLGYAQCLLNQGRADDAWEIFQKVEHDGPPDSSFLFSKAQASLDSGRTDEARDILQELCDRWPEVAPFRELQARTEQARNRIAEAETIFAIARSSQSRQPEIDRLISMLDANPSEIGVRLQIGRLMMYYLSPEAGSGQIQSVIAMDPNNLIAHQLMADYYRRERKPTPSLRHQQKAEQLMASMNTGGEKGVASGGQ